MPGYFEIPGRTPTERRMGLFLFEFSAGEGYIRYAYIACNMEVTPGNPRSFEAQKMMMKHEGW